jgi:hypothetical protein
VNSLTLHSGTYLEGLKKGTNIVIEDSRCRGEIQTSRIEISSVVAEVSLPSEHSKKHPSFCSQTLALCFVRLLQLEH